MVTVKSPKTRRSGVNPSRNPVSFFSALEKKDMPRHDAIRSAAWCGFSSILPELTYFQERSIILFPFKVEWWVGGGGVLLQRVPETLSKIDKSTE